MAEFEVILQDKETSARLGKLHINRWEVETPILWLGHNLKGPIYPWRADDSNVPGVLVNACQILERQNVLERVQTVGIQEFLDYPGPVMMDSGGFRFQSRPGISVSTDEIMSLYQDAGVDIGVILDHPFDPSVSERENGDRWKKTLRNLRSMSGQSNGDFILMPVVHGYSAHQLRKSCKQIIDIIGSPALIGLGSLVPLLKGNYTKSKFGRGKGVTLRL
jgi:tRNA-guanine family transglycosylase